MHANLFKVNKLILSIFISISLLVAFAGSCFDIDINPDDDKNTEQSSKKDSKSSERETIGIDLFNAIVQAGHIVIHSDFDFEINRSEDNERALPVPYRSVLLFTDFYKTLFQRIISPNAP